MKADISSCDAIQKRAVTELGGRNIIVGASAGAGKTKVLVTRIMKRIVEDRVSVDRIMALTFTSAAAEEMKNRLASELYKLHDAAESSEDAEYLARQIALLSTAQITTIDSWCLNVIKKYYNVIGLDPATTANVLSEGSYMYLLEAAFHRALHDLAGESGGRDMYDLARFFSPRPEDYTALFSAVKQLLNCAQSSCDPEAWLAKARSMWVAFDTLKQLPADVRLPFFTDLMQKCRDLDSILENILAILTEEEDKALKKEMIIAIRNRLGDCIRMLEDEDYTAFRENLYELAVIKEKKPKDERLLSLHADMRAMIDSLLAVSYAESDLACASRHTSRIASSLITLTENTMRYLDDLKKENTCIYFSDMERYALEILEKHDGRVAKIISDSLDEIMIDEFQDTSMLQDSILRRIAFSKPIFRVGDVKQSIYRFRQAKPQLMRDLMNDENNTVLTLKYNYRSNSRIVEFTNLLFERLMNIEGISDVYGERDHVSAGSEAQKKNLSDPHVHMVLIRNQNTELTAEGKPKKLPARRARILKAEWIAAKIIALHNEKNMRWGSFAVLTRSHEDQRAVRAALEKAGIPYDIDTKEGFYRSDLCQDVLSLLKVLSTPADSLALMAVLTSPLFALSDEEIAVMKLTYGSLHKGVAETYPAIAETLRRLKTLALSKGVTEMLKELACTPAGNGTVWYDVLSEKDRANYDYLFQKTASSDRDDILSVIHEIEISQDEKSSEAITAGKDDDTVTAATIHHSKGLQYDCVFLWGTEASRFRSDGILMTDDDLTVGLKDVDPETRIVMPTVQSMNLKRKAGREDLEEFTRLLYVAVTRAKEELYVVDMEDAAMPYREKLTLSDLEKRGGITGLLTSALDHSEGITEGGLLETLYPGFSGLDGNMKRPPESRYAKEHPRLALRIRELPAIRTPSSLERPAGMERPGLPPLSLSEGAGGAAYGTMMHALMERLPDDAEWDAQLIRTIEPDAPDHVIEAAMRFYENPLYRKARSMEIHKEYPFYYEDENTRMNGTMDFVAIGSDEIILIDFKTDRKTPQEILHAYTPQLEAYRMVLHSFYPDIPVKAYAYSFHNRCEIKIP